MNQLYVYVYPHILSLLSLPPTLPIPSLQVITKLCTFISFCVYFVYVCMAIPMKSRIWVSKNTLKGNTWICQ